MSGVHSAASTSEAAPIGRAHASAAFALPAMFAATLFASAALLFFVEPMFAKMVLPQLGGSPAVWNTCVVFFQAVMLAGYTYAHIIARLTVRGQIVLHSLLLVAAGLTLPVSVPFEWAPPVGSSPVLPLLLLLASSLGGPFLAISATAPLLQRWFSQTGHRSAGDPYFLYAASNVGSMVALLGYPFVVEPSWPLAAQSRFWTLGYAGLAGLAIACGAAAVAFRERSAGPKMENPSPEDLEAEDLSWTRRAHWAALAFVPSSLMLGVTSFLSNEVAAVPLLWTVPLALYLLTFVLAFSSVTVIPRRLALNSMKVLLLPLILVILLDVSQPAWAIMPLHLIAVFACSLVLHGRLAQDRPGTGHLTEFYVWISVGGVLGGMFNTLLAPFLFTGVLEYPLAIVLAAALYSPDRTARGPRRVTPADVGLGLALGAVGIGVLVSLSTKALSPIAFSLCVGLVGALYTACTRHRVRLAAALAAITFGGGVFVQREGDLVYAERTFFGVLRVRESVEQRRRVLLHGNTLHGAQSLDLADRDVPLTYYHPSGPIGQAITAMAGRIERIAVVGLGAGSLAAYAAPGQQWTFYEIDPAVERIARSPQFFTYLDRCGDRCAVVLGDARLSLAGNPSARYDAIILDAFSSDAIPTHLLTLQAVELYLARLTESGILAFHISNRHLDLKPVLGALAKELGLVAKVQHHQPDRSSSAQASEWVLMARPAAQPAFLNDERWRPLATSVDRIWTDDYSDIISVLVRPAFMRE